MSHQLAKPAQIAVREALPFGEMKPVPYPIMCITSGGHLSWPKTGGGSNLFARPILIRAFQLEDAYLTRFQASSSLNKWPRKSNPPNRSKVLGKFNQSVSRLMLSILRLSTQWVESFLHSHSSSRPQWWEFRVGGGSSSKSDSFLANLGSYFGLGRCFRWLSISSR